MPDAPTDLQNVPAITDADTIGLSWAAPEFDGGSPILDYRLWSDNASGSDFAVLEGSLAGFTYTATSLVQGATYQFKIEARNAYGFSAFSNIVTILTA